MNSKIALHAMNEHIKANHTLMHHVSTHVTRWACRGRRKGSRHARFEIDLLITNLTRYRATVPLPSWGLRPSWCTTGCRSLWRAWRRGRQGRGWRGCRGRGSCGQSEVRTGSRDQMPCSDWSVLTCSWWTAGSRRGWRNSRTAAAASLKTGYV